MKPRWLYMGVVISLVISNVQLSIAQEYQHELSYAKNVVSIIREVNRTSSFVYVGYQGRSSFAITDESAGTYSELGDLLPYHRVTDVELLGDTVYCCGYRQDTAFLLKFCISNSADTVPYQYMPFILNDAVHQRITRFHRLEVTPIGGIVHVYAVGSDALGHSCLVEVLSNGTIGLTGSNVAIVSCASSVNSFDDVAVTGNFVVVTERNPIQEEGRYVRFDIPASPTNAVGNILFPVPTITNWNSTLQYNVPSNLQLEHCEDDIVVVASVGPGNSGAIVSAHNVSTMSPLAALQIGTSDYSIVPADIKYDPNSRVLQMLGRVTQPDSAGDIVFHLMPSTAGTTSGVIQGHQFPDQWMFSIDRSVCSSGHTLATGRPLRHYNPLTNVYKHHYAIYQQCTREKIATYRQLTAVYSDEEEDVGRNFYSIEWQTRFLVGIGRAINPICN